MTLQCQARSRLRCWTGVTVPSTMTTWISPSAISCPSASTVPLPISVAGRGWLTWAISAATTTRSIACARATASASRASGERVGIPPEA